ncbi:Fis family transcriptional regulator [Opitutaceae bacterium EW11]|nr:Fis family transcriptional regulator [Opitutaceae bacterium EW11]
MSAPFRICLVDDDDSARISIERVLVSEGYAVSCHRTGESGLADALEAEFDCVLTDLRMPGVSGIELVAQLQRELPNLPVVLMTAHGTTDIAIEATRQGAFDYVVKPFEMEDLLTRLGRACAAGRRGREMIALGPVTPEAVDGPSLIGQSRAMQEVCKELGRAAGRPVPVLILGETGTGKELVARALWQHGDRRSRAFVAVNCAAIPPNLLETELFGYERGAFTGADVRRIGRFEQAHGGTLFLDEIGDLQPETQAKLLRVLQERVISRVGGRETIPVDVRVIAATHRDLPAMVAAGAFREDLWYRLNVVTIRLPPLRERREDIPPLVVYFVRRFGPDLGGTTAIEPEAVRLLGGLPWPGNVRELENVVKRLLLMAHGYPITRDMAAAATSGAQPGNAAGVSGRTLSALCREVLEDADRGGPSAAAAAFALLERELLEQAMASSGGNITRTAQLLGWSRVTVREKLKLHGLRAEATE